MKEPLNISKEYTLHEIHQLFESGLLRPLTEMEHFLVDNWVNTLGKEERATILNMLKELLNKHKRID